MIFQLRKRIRRELKVKAFHQAELRSHNSSQVKPIQRIKKIKLLSYGPRVFWEFSLLFLGNERIGAMLLTTFSSSHQNTTIIPLLGVVNRPAERDL